MIRIKLASERKTDFSNIDEIDFVKRTDSIEDAAVDNFYANLQKNAGANVQNLEATLAEIRCLFASFLNSEAEAAKIVEALHRDYSVTEFKDLKRISQAEYANVLKKNTNLVEKDVEMVVKSVLASMA